MSSFKRNPSKRNNWRSSLSRKSPEVYYKKSYFYWYLYTVIKWQFCFTTVKQKRRNPLCSENIRTTTENKGLNIEISDRNIMVKSFNLQGSLQHDITIRNRKLYPQKVVNFYPETDGKISKWCLLHIYQYVTNSAIQLLLAFKDIEMMKS